MCEGLCSALGSAAALLQDLRPCQSPPVPGAALCFVLGKKPGLKSRGQRKEVHGRGTSGVVVTMTSSEILRLTCCCVSVRALSSQLWC